MRHGDIGISVVVMHELCYGAFKILRVEQNVARVDALQLPVLELDQDDVRQAGAIRAHLASKGTPIGPYDVLIAGQAMVRKLTLVTHNTSEFTRVPGLKVEDWHRTATSPPARGPAAARAWRRFHITRAGLLIGALCL